MCPESTPEYVRNEIFALREVQKILLEEYWPKYLTGSYIYLATTQFTLTHSSLSAITKTSKYISIWDNRWTSKILNTLSNPANSQPQTTRNWTTNLAAWNRAHLQLNSQLKVESLTIDWRYGKKKSLRPPSHVIQDILCHVILGNQWALMQYLISQPQNVIYCWCHNNFTSHLRTPPLHQTLTNHGGHSYQDTTNSLTNRLREGTRMAIHLTTTEFHTNFHQPTSPLLTLMASQVEWQENHHLL